MSNSPDTFITLLENCGAISHEVADELRQKLGTPPPLGKILLDRHWLTMHQVAKILTQQADDPTALFGQIAVELGFCRQAQVDEALTDQRQKAPNAFELAYGHPQVETEQLMPVLMNYLRHLEAVVHQLAEKDSVDVPSSLVARDKADAPAG